MSSGGCNSGYETKWSVIKKSLFYDIYIYIVELHTTMRLTLDTTGGVT